MPGEIQKINAGEDDEKPAQQRNRVDSIGRVEAFEKDEGSAQCGRRERHIIKGIDSGEENCQLRLCYGASLLTSK